MNNKTQKRKNFQKRQKNKQKSSKKALLKLNHKKIKIFSQKSIY